MTWRVFIGGLADGEWRNCSPECPFWQIDKSLSGASFDPEHAPAAQTMRRATYIPLDLHIDRSIFTVMRHEKISPTEAMRKLIAGYGKSIH